MTIEILRTVFALIGVLTVSALLTFFAIIAFDQTDTPDGDRWPDGEGVDPVWGDDDTDVVNEAAIYKRGEDQ